MWKQQFVFLCLPSRLSERQCCPISARDSVFPPLREAVLFCLCERQCPFGLCERQCCWASARGILLSVCMRDSFLFDCTLVDARISHVVMSHLLRALDHVVATSWFCESKQHVSSWLISAISSGRHECHHPADRYIHKKGSLGKRERKKEPKQRKKDKKSEK